MWRNFFFLEKMVRTNESRAFTSKDTQKIRFNFLKNKESKTYTCSTSSSINNYGLTDTCTGEHTWKKQKQKQPKSQQMVTPIMNNMTLATPCSYKGIFVPLVFTSYANSTASAPMNEYGTNSEKSTATGDKTF